MLHKKEIATSRYKVPRSAIFLDRDGVVIEDVHYIRKRECVKLLAGAKKLIETAVRKMIPVVLITNQSGISKGLFGWREYDEVTEEMKLQLGENCRFAGIYASGDSESTSTYSWRKPLPRMIEEAAKDLNIDVRSSVLVGDRMTDLQCGLNAGVERLVHVMSSSHAEREVARINEWEKELRVERVRYKIERIKNLEEFCLRADGE